MSLGKKMLRAAVPEVELPQWFEVQSNRVDGKTTLTLSATIGGQKQTIEKVLEQEAASVMDVISLWPSVEGKVPGMARKVLAFLPVPSHCKITGAPRGDSSATKEGARLSLQARVMGNDMNWHWDSTLDKLYMADLVEMVDWLKAIQKTKETKGADHAG